MGRPSRTWQGAVSGPADGLVLTAEDSMAVRACSRQVVAWPPLAMAPASTVAQSTDAILCLACRRVNTST
jgi:hypothetical protein